MQEFVVTEAFGLDGVLYERGTRINDHENMKRIAEQFPNHVVRTETPDNSPSVQKGE